MYIDINIYTSIYINIYIYTHTQTHTHTHTHTHIHIYTYIYNIYVCIYITYTIPVLQVGDFLVQALYFLIGLDVYLLQPALMLYHHQLPHLQYLRTHSFFFSSDKKSCKCGKKLNSDCSAGVSRVRPTPPFFVGYRKNNAAQKTKSGMYNIGAVLECTI